MTYNRASNDKLAIVETGGIQLDQDFIRAKLAFRWHWNVLLILEGAFKALLARQDPLSSHDVKLMEVL